MTKTGIGLSRIWSKCNIDRRRRLQLGCPFTVATKVGHSQNIDYTFEWTRWQLSNKRQCLNFCFFFLRKTIKAAIIKKKIIRQYPEAHTVRRSILSDPIKETHLRILVDGLIGVDCHQNRTRVRLNLVKVNKIKQKNQNRRVFFFYSIVSTHGLSCFQLPHFAEEAFKDRLSHVFFVVYFGTSIELFR